LLFGASGDLAGRLLLPALGDLLDKEPERRNVVLIGAGSEDWDDATWKDRIKSSFAAGKVSEETVQAVLGSTRYPGPTSRTPRICAVSSRAARPRRSISPCRPP